MVERKGGQPGPGQPRSEQRSGQADRQVIRGAELEALRRTHPDIRSSFAVRWTDAQGSHLAYNYRQTVGRGSENRVVFDYNEPPTFESNYRDWHLGPAHIRRPDGDVESGELYGLYLDLKSRRGRRALKRFLHEADESGYSVASWFSTPRSGAVTQDGAPVTSLTFLLQHSSEEEQSAPRTT